MIRSTAILDQNGGYTIRTYTGKLERYGQLQESFYGAKNILIKQVEKRYIGVDLGRYVRHLCGDIILFFPHKTGLIGTVWNQRQWEATYLEDGTEYDGLYSLTPGVDIKLRPSEYQHLYRSFGLVRDDAATREYRRLHCESLHVYQRGKLYKANYAEDKTLHLSKVLCKDRKVLI